MKKYLEVIKEKKWVPIIIFGAMAFSFILITTFNLVLALFGFVIFSSLAIFQRSFHYGLLFFLAIILVFPPIDIVVNIINIGEVLGLLLVLVGSASFLLDKPRIKILAVFYYWITLVSVFMIRFLFFEENIKIFYEINKGNINKFIVVLIIFPIIITSFQYFFQTTRRLERFFLTIVIVGIIQAIIAIIFFNKSLYSIQLIQVDWYSWSILMTITIPVTFGMLLIQKSSLSTLEFSWFKKRRNNINKIIDAVTINKKKKLKRNVINLKRFRLNIQIVLVIGLILQAVALISTSSYIVLITVGIGIFIIGVLMRDRNIILTTLFLLLGLVIILSGIKLSFTAQLKQGIMDILLNVKNSQGVEFLWQGVGSRQQQNESSSYLFVFNRLGLAGLVIFILSLVQYFREIRNAYLKSDEFERVWIIIILAIFIEFVVLGMLINVFFIWPTALLFWLLYGILQNLKSRKKEYSLIGTTLQ